MSSDSRRARRALRLRSDPTVGRNLEGNTSSHVASLSLMRSKEAGEMSFVTVSSLALCVDGIMCQVEPTYCISGP